jgi:hypothetical protein
MENLLFRQKTPKHRGILGTVVARIAGTALKLQTINPSFVTHLFYSVGQEEW